MKLMTAELYAIPMKPLCLCCDRCNRQQPTARSYTTAGVCYTLCEPCREEFDRPATPDRPRDQRDISLHWLF
ncbi:hypothetical protein [Pseudomonas amygdali]|uniref:hypothetical protein n=1 Tax=Pseudomonas amygdali TaxID=47877 RepID=UPI0006E65644|nr:hypothetical protein [Pseudomonas amygdali]KPY56092.1 hypothetical protein ALO93_200313 [Pseudomonas amygdali pv. sesami]RMV77948.1 hypothetical protein ALP04_200056 [Pseudomonas amygdali pv. sesami]